MDKRNKLVDRATGRPLRLNYDFVDVLQDGLARVLHNNRWGIIDSEGHVVAPLIYEWASKFAEGRVGVQLNGKYGFIDLEGNEVAPPIYDYVGFYHEGMVLVRSNEKFGVIDLDGNEVIPCWYDDVKKQSYGFSASTQNTPHRDEHLYFDRDGNLIPEPMNE
jgi:hypothetical protein